MAATTAASSKLASLLRATCAPPSERPRDSAIGSRARDASPVADSRRCSHKLFLQLAGLLVGSRLLETGSKVQRCLSSLLHKTAFNRPRHRFLERALRQLSLPPCRV